jgi:hypothetical protein
MQVNKYEPCTEGQVCKLAKLEGPGQLGEEEERGHIKVEFGGMVCYTLREYRYEGDAYEQYV